MGLLTAAGQALPSSFVIEGQDTNSSRLVTMMVGRVFKLEYLLGGVTRLSFA